MKKLIVIAFCFVIAFATMVKAAEIKSTEEIQKMTIEELQEYFETLTKEQLASILSSVIATNDDRTVRMVLAAVQNVINNIKDNSTRVEYVREIVQKVPAIAGVVRPGGTVVLTLAHEPIIYSSPAENGGRPVDNTPTVSNPAYVAP